jgi:hypothetical protein
VKLLDYATVFTFVTNQSPDIVNIDGYDWDSVKVYESLINPQDESERCEIFPSYF